ncbi:MAG: murein biosynthesis integral membrane protein MurJ [Chloroflexota bacterium]|nr:murein biosynthesis integral membrane protein MurJ [Chloroflexota bacterium]MDE2908195.1 murein biosynthesis integral membrane protein MurJ [Chloroflexota bacterium]
MTQSDALGNREIIEKAVIVLAGFVASGLLGLARLAVVGAQFGTGAAYDAFAAAQQLPESVFVLVAGGALGSSFIPIYARYRVIDQEAASRLASAVMTLSATGAALLGLLVHALAPQLVALVLYRERSYEEQQLMIDMIRLMMLTPFIFSISGLLMGLLQSHAAFWLPAIALSMNNIGIIIGALLIAPALSPHPDVGQVGDLNIMGLAYGAVLSALLHLLAQLPGLVKLPMRLRPLLAPRVAGVADVLRLMLPRVFGLAVVQINFHVNIILANTMVAGSVGAVRYAFMLTFFALGVIAQSQGSAVFPTLAALKAEGDYDSFKDRLSRAMRNVLCLSFPASALLIVLGEPLVSVLQRGEWTNDSTGAVAWALGFYALGIAGFALLEVLSRAFYALEDTRTPALAGAIAMLSNIVLNLIFIQIIGDPDSLARGAFAGLALANALTTLVEALALWWLIRRRLSRLGSSPGIHDREVLMSAGGSLLLSLLMAIVLWLLTLALPAGGLTLALGGCALAALIFFGSGYLFDISEIRPLLEPFVRRLLSVKR